MKCIFFGATWCAPCSTLKPIWKKLSEETEDVEFVTVDIDNEPELASKYSVSAVPTILFLKDGEVVDSLIGLHKESDIRSAIDTLVKRGDNEI